MVERTPIKDKVVSPSEQLFSLTSYHYFPIVTKSLLFTVVVKVTVHSTTAQDVTSCSEGPT